MPGHPVDGSLRPPSTWGRVLWVVPVSRVAMDTSSLPLAFGPPLTFRHQLPRSSLAMSLNVAKYHLGKVKPERVGQRSLPAQYVTFGAALRALLTLVFFAAFVAFAVLLCLLIVADHSCCWLQFLAPSPPSLGGGGGEQGLGICQVSIFLGKYLH